MKSTLWKKWKKLHPGHKVKKYVPIGEARQRVSKNHKVEPYFDDGKNIYDTNQPPHKCYIDEILKLCPYVPAIQCRHIIKAGKILCERCHQYLHDLITTSDRDRYGYSIYINPLDRDWGWSPASPDHVDPYWLRDMHSCKTGECRSNKTHAKFMNAIACNSCLSGFLSVFSHCKDSCKETSLTYSRATEIRKIMYTFIMSVKKNGFTPPPKDVYKLIFGELKNSEYCDLKVDRYTFLSFNRRSDVKVLHRKTCQVGIDFDVLVSARNTEDRFLTGEHQIKPLFLSIFGEKSVSYPSRGIFVHSTKFKLKVLPGRYGNVMKCYGLKDFQLPEMMLFTSRMRLCRLKTEDRHLSCYSEEIHETYCPDSRNSEPCPRCNTGKYCSDDCSFRCCYSKTGKCFLRYHNQVIHQFQIAKIVFRHSARRVPWYIFLHEWMKAHLRFSIHDTKAKMKFPE